MTKNEVVPFGKYRGKPVEALQEDRAYCDWLIAQPWFRERFAGLFTIIVNNFTEPTSTPEHNKLQCLFLDQEFRDRIFDRFQPGRRLDWAVIKQLDDLADAERELRRSFYFPEHHKAKAEQAVEEARQALALARLTKAPEPTKVEFEVGGVDVVLTLGGCISIGIEVKPTMGDDYPAVLRQMKATKNCRVLYLGVYQGEGASFEQMTKIFAASGIAIVLHGDALGRA